MTTPVISRKGQRNTILIVDDNEMIRDWLANVFEEEHGIKTASDGAEGLEILHEFHDSIYAILLDVHMPQGMDGITMLEELAKDNIPSQIPIFLITGEKDEKIIARAYNLGVMDVISKNTSPYVVQRRVNSVIELFTARNHFEEVVNQQTEELQVQNKQLAVMNKGMIEALATATEFRSGESGEHVRRIHDITHMFLTRTPLGAAFTREEIEQISNAAILHDVGKISIPDAILNKPGRFTDEEFELMKQHTVNGEKMLTQIPQLKNLPFYDYAKTIARHHHERWDGRGYPDNLKGDEIPLCSQIVSLADVYDALVSARVYKPPFSHEQAVNMIMEGKCGIFNPDLLKQFEIISPKIQNIYKNNHSIPPMEE